MKPRRKEAIPALLCLVSIVLMMPRPSDASEEYFYGGHLSAVDGSVWIQSAYDSELSTAEMNLLVEESTRIVTGQDGRAEVQLAGNHVLRLWHDTEVDFFGVEGPVEIWMKLGSIYVRTIPEGSEGYVQKIVTPASTVYVTGGTILRIDVEPDERTRVTVLEGNAEVVSDGDSLWLESRQTAMVYVARIYGPAWLGTGLGDGFVRWCEEREAVLAGPLDPRSAPVDVPAVSELDPYGSWVYVPGLSVRVWRPRVVVGWSPYCHGRWTWSVRYGLFWVSNEPWGWIPYHYGSWSWYSSFGWVWVPGHMWHGARVSWVRCGDYIGWRPLLYSSNHITVKIPAKNHTYCFVHKNSITRPVVRSVELDKDHLVRHRTVALKSPSSILSPPARVRKRADRPAVNGGYGQRPAERTPTVARHMADPGSQPLRTSGLQDRSSRGRVTEWKTETREPAKVKTIGQVQDQDTKPTGLSRGTARRTGVPAPKDPVVNRRKQDRPASSSNRNPANGVPMAPSKTVASVGLEETQRNAPNYGSISAKKPERKSLEDRNFSTGTASSIRRSSGNRSSVDIRGNAAEKKGRVSSSRSSGSDRTSSQRGRR